MGSWNDPKNYQTIKLNLGLWYLMHAFNQILASERFGGEDGDATGWQGCWSHGGASANTHAEEDAIDITPYNWRNREKAGRLLGLALWHRPAIRGVWVEHMHGITDGGSAAAAGQKQVSMYHKRQNGLANYGRDEGYQMMVFPKFVFPEKAIGKPGVMYTKRPTSAWDQPTKNSMRLDNMSRNHKLNVVAVVNVSGAYWALNQDGKCVPMEDLSRFAIPAK